MMDSRDRVPADLEREEHEFFRSEVMQAARDRAGRCPAPVLVLAMSEGVLPADTQASVATHVADCVLCQTLVEASRDPSTLVITANEEARIRQRLTATPLSDAVPAASPSVTPRWRRWTVPLAAAASVVLAVVLVRTLREPPPPTVSPAQTTSPGEPASVHLRVEKAPVELPLDSVIRWRGSPDTSRPDEMTELQQALEPYRRDDFQDAAARLVDLARTHPRNAYVQFYLGVSWLMLNRDAAATASLETAERLAEGSLMTSAAWYLATVYDRTGQRDRALEKLRTLCAGRSREAERACEAEKEMLRLHR